MMRVDIFKRIYRVLPSILLVSVTIFVPIQGFSAGAPPAIEFAQNYPGMEPALYHTGMCFSDSAVMIKTMQSASFEMSRVKVLILANVVTGRNSWARHAVVYHEDGFIYDPSMKGNMQQAPLLVEPISIREYFKAVVRDQPVFVRVVESEAYLTMPGLSFYADFPQEDGLIPEPKHTFVGAGPVLPLSALFGLKGRIRVQ